MKSFIKLCIVLLLSAVTVHGFSQISVTPEDNAMSLANNLIGSESGVTIVSASLIGATGAAGTFSGGTFGISEGIVLTSGFATTAVGPNNSGGAGSGRGTAGDAQLDSLASPFSTNDACILSITFIPNGNSLEFSYVFGSEEYNEYVCSSFNDVFGFFVNGGVYDNQNIALIPGTTPPMPVAINNVNNGTVGSAGSANNCSDLQLANSAYYVDNPTGTNLQYDGHTVVLTAVIAVEPGTQYSIKLAIADAGDDVLDSGVFLEGQSFVSVVCDAGVVSADPALPASFCPENIPASISPSHSSASGSNDSYKYLVTDAAGGIHAVVAQGSDFNPQGWPAGTYSIYGISYSGNLFGAEVDNNIANVSADGCFDISDPLNFTILDDCDTYDCPSLEANIGDACDDGDSTTENDMVTADCGCAGTPIEYDCPELGANIGDPCPLETEPEFAKGGTANIGPMGVVGPNCNCIPQQVNNCINWEYFLADYKNDTTTIYKVVLDEVNAIANLTEMKKVGYEVHIAFNEADGLLYLVKKSDGSFQTLDVSVVNGTLSAFVPLSTPLSGSIQAAFAPNGKLVIGSQDTDEFISVNVTTGVRSPYATGDIFGGDLVFDNSGQPFFVTRSSGVFYQLNPGFTNTMIGSVPFTVTGLALKDDNSFVVSVSGSNQLLARTNAGANNGTYDIKLNGMAFTTSSGDMSSGCAQPGFEEGDCSSFSMFYVNHDATISGSDLYRVQFTPTDAILTFLTNVPFEAHIGFDAMNSIVYFVEKQGTLVRAYDPALDIYLGDIPLTPGPVTITAVVFNPVDGLLYIGDDAQNKIYTLNPANGNTVFFADAPVSGGDLAIQGNVLYLTTKNGNALYDLSGAVPAFVSNIPSTINGTAQANNSTDLILSNRNTTIFSKINASNGAPVSTYNAMLNGSPFTLLNGDMAAGCAENQGGEECQNFKYYFIADNSPGMPQGNVYTGSITGGDFVLNYLFNAGMMGHIAVNTYNGNIYVVNNNGKNLKTFDAGGTLLNNVTIGLSATYAIVFNPFNNTVYIGSASTSKVWQVDPATGNKTLFASGLPVSGGDLVINNAGELFLVQRANNTPSHLYNITTGSAVWVADVAPSVNGAALTDTDGFIMAEGDGSTSFHLYDGSGNYLSTLNSVDNSNNPFVIYDGDMASGCIVNAGAKGEFMASQSTLTSYPNPTTGPSKVIFTSAESGISQLEVYDMNGRLVKVLFKGQVNANLAYSVDFEGTGLPNGVYIFKLTDPSGVTIDKFMIAR